MFQNKVTPIALGIGYKSLDGNKYLFFQKRRTSDFLKGLLEFPGGKVEIEESPKDAMCREWHEEVGSLDWKKYEITPYGPFKYNYPDMSLLFFPFVFSLNIDFESGEWKKLRSFDDWRDFCPAATQVIIKKIFFGEV